jgi:hypothetical protein
VSTDVYRSGYDTKLECSTKSDANSEHLSSIDSIELLKRRNLDALRKEVSCLGGVVRDGKTVSQLRDNGFSRCQSLGPESKDTNHSKTAVLKFLQSLLFVLFGTVVESEGVVAAITLSDAEVSGRVCGSLFLDDPQTAEFKNGHEEEDLQKSKTGGLVEGLKGVGVAVSINTSPFVSGESSEKSGGDESNNGDLGNTSMDELGLAVPGQVIGESVASLKSSEPWANRDGRETKGVETNISQHGSIKGSGGSGERKGNGRSFIGPGSSGRRGSSSLRREQNV